MTRCTGHRLGLTMTTVAVAIILLVASSVDARPRPAGKSRRKTFEANKTFGLGIMVGAPTGLSGKYFISDDNALAFGVGTIYEYRDRRGVHLHLDYLWHPFSLSSNRSFELPLYFGIGGRILDGRRCYRYDRGRCDYYYGNYRALGLRAPLGISFDFNNVPLDIFLEMALVFDFVVDHDDAYDDALYIDLNGTVGVRYYFN